MPQLLIAGSTARAKGVHQLADDVDPL